MKPPTREYRTDIESATQTDASYPQTKVQEEQVNQAPVVARPVGPSRSREKRRRGVPRPHWRKMTWVLIVWSAFIVIWAISGTASNDCGSQARQAAKSGCEAGTGIGVAFILVHRFFRVRVLLIDLVHDAAKGPGLSCLR